MKYHHHFQTRILNKLVFLTFLGLLFTQQSFSQTRFGVKTGYTNYLTKSASALHSADNLTYSHRVDYLGQSNSKTVGLYYRKQFNFLFTEVSLNYTSFNRSFKLYEFEDFENPFSQPATTGGPEEFTGLTYREFYQNLDISIIGGYQRNNLSIGVGPVLHRSVSHDSQLSQLDFYKSTKKPLDVGFQFVVGYSLGPMQFNLNFENLFLKAGDHFTLHNSDLKINQSINAIKFEVGIGF